MSAIVASPLLMWSFRCAKIINNKKSLTIKRIIVEYGYIDGIESQGFRWYCYQVHQD